MRVLLLLLLAWQSRFDVASVKPSGKLVGPDYGNVVKRTPTGFSAKNTTLKRLIAEAYDVRPFQVTGGPKWLDTAEYDIEARGSGLQELLQERFHLKIHRETVAARVYELRAGKNRPKLKPGEKSMDDFAAFLAVELAIHGIDDPTKPGMAGTSVVPVVNRTGLTGQYDVNIDVKPEPGADMFTLWQRALRDELGLRLESVKTRVETLVVDSADKMPIAN